MLLKVKDELVEIFLEYDEQRNIDIKARKLSDEGKIYAYIIGYFSKGDGILHLIDTIEKSGLPTDNEGYLQVKK